MTWVQEFWRSSIGGKTTMAVTGVLLFLFVIAHLLGNLQIFAGEKALNDYAKMLHDLGPLLWVARIGLLAIFVLHVLTAIRLSRANKAARPVPYAKEATVQASFASRSMLFSGLSLLAFVIYHVMHFTFRVVHVPAEYCPEAAKEADVKGMVIDSFSRPEVVLVYVSFQILLFLHLKHGLQSFAQTLGWRHARYTSMVQALSFVLAAAIAGGNILIALAPMLGLVQKVAA